jgi:hypothetical protein
MRRARVAGKRKARTERQGKWLASGAAVVNGQRPAEFLCVEHISAAPARRRKRHPKMIAGAQRQNSTTKTVDKAPTRKPKWLFAALRCRLAYPLREFA